MRIDWDTAKAQAHIESLAEIHGVTIVWTERSEAAHIAHKVIHCQRPTTPYRYLGCLHEMGHVVSTNAIKYYKRWDRRKPHWSPTAYDDMLLMEAAAWAWACRNVPEDIEISKRTWSQCGQDLGTYLRATAEQ